MLSGLDLLVAVVWIALLLVELVARARRSLSCHDATEEREHKQLGSRTSLEGDGGFHLPLPPKRRAATAGDLIRLPLAPLNLMRQRTKPAGPTDKAQGAAAQPPRATAQAATVPSKNSSSSSAVAKAQAAASARPKAAVKRNKSVDACQNRAPVATAVAATAAATPALTPTATSLAPAAAQAGTAAATAASAAVARQPSVIRGVVPPPQLLAGLPAATLPCAANPTPNPSAPRSRGDRYSGPRVPVPDGSRGPEHQRQQHLQQPVAVVKTPRSGNSGGRVGSVQSGSAVSPASAMPALSLGPVPTSLAVRVLHTRPQGAARSASASPAAAPASIATVCQRSLATPCGVAAGSPPAKHVSSTKFGMEKPQVRLDKQLEPQQPQPQSEGRCSIGGSAEGALESSTPDDPEDDVWLPPPPACGSSASSPSEGVLSLLPGRLSPRQQAAELAAVAAPAASPPAAPAAAAPVVHAALLVAVIPARPAACRSGVVPSQQCSSSQDKTQEQVPQVPQAHAQDAVPPAPLLVRQLSICCAPVATPSAPTSLSPATSTPPPASGGWDAEAARALASCASPRPRPSSSFATPRERRSPSSAGMCLAEPNLMPSAVSASAGATAAAVAAAGATASTAQAVRQHGRLLRQVSAGAATTPVWAAQADADTAASATPPRQLTVSAFRTPPRTPPVCSPAAPRGFNMLQASPFSPSVLTPPPALPPPPPSPSRVLRPVPVSAGGSSVRPRAPATPTAEVAVCVEEAGQEAAGVPPRSPSVLARAAHFEQVARVQAAAAAAAVTAASASPAPSPCGANAAAAPHGGGQHEPRVPRGSGGGSAAASRGVAHACCSDSPVCGLQPSMSAPVLWAGPSLSTGGSLAAGSSCLPADAAVDASFSCAGLDTGGQSGLGGMGGSAGGASADCSIMPSRASSFSVASSAANASHISSSGGGVCSSRTSWTGLGPASGACSLGGSSSRSLGGDIASCGNSSGGGAPAAVIHVGGNVTPTSS